MGHIDGLRGALGDGALSRLWYTGARCEDHGRLRAGSAAGAAEGRVLPFVVFDANDQIVGTTRYYDLQADVPRLSIGYTWYGESAQRTGVNTETKLMLLSHAFERLQCLSVVFETSWFNFTSRTAIARLGAKQDGVLRNPSGTPTARRATPSSSPSSMRNGRA